MQKMALSVKDAAEELGISESTCYWMIHTGALPHNRVSARGSKGKGKILISRMALEKWLLGQPGEKHDTRPRIHQG